jgi:hypothetical protein
MSSAAVLRAGKEFAAADREVSEAASSGNENVLTSAAPAAPADPVAQGAKSQVTMLISAGVYSAGWYKPGPARHENPELYEKMKAESDAKFARWLAVVEQVRKRVSPLISRKPHFDRVQTDTADLRYTYEGSVQELANQVEFAKVRSVNETTRTIELELDRKFPEVP